MKIRAATSNDFPAIAHIQSASWKDAYRGILPDDYLRDQVSADVARHWAEIEITHDDVVLVAENDKALGFIAVWCRPEPLIDNLHVLPNARSRGTGAQLMVAAAGELLQRAHRNAYLWVMAGNLRAIHFYERLGGVQAESAVKRFFGNDVANVKIVWDDLSVIETSGREQRASKH